MEPSRIAQRMTKITLSDTGDALYIGIRANEDGVIKFRTNSSEDITLNVVAGEILPVIVTRVYATGTTVTNVHGFL